MFEDPPRGLRPMRDAPQERSIRIELRDGSTRLVSWRWECGPVPTGFWSAPPRSKVWGWYTRAGTLIDEREIVGWFEADETL